MINSNFKEDTFGRDITPSMGGMGFPASIPYNGGFFDNSFPDRANSALPATIKKVRIPYLLSNSNKTHLIYV